MGGEKPPTRFGFTRSITYLSYVTQQPAPLGNHPWGSEEKERGLRVTIRGLFGSDPTVGSMGRLYGIFTLILDPIKINAIHGSVNIPGYHRPNHPMDPFVREWPGLDAFGIFGAAQKRPECVKMSKRWWVLMKGFCWVLAFFTRKLWGKWHKFDKYDLFKWVA